MVINSVARLCNADLYGIDNDVKAFTYAEISQVLIQSACGVRNQCNDPALASEIADDAKHLVNQELRNVLAVVVGHSRKRLLSPFIVGAQAGDCRLK